MDRIETPNFEVRSSLVAKRALVSIFALGVASFSLDASAFRKQDMSGDDSGAAAVFGFDGLSLNSDGTFNPFSVDATSSLASPLTLETSTEGNISPVRPNALVRSGYLLVNYEENSILIDGDLQADQGYQRAQSHRTMLWSTVAPAALNQCSRGFTIQAFIRPHFPFNGSADGAVIVSLTNSTTSALAVPNFALLQTGQRGAETASVRVRLSDGSSQTLTSVPAAFSSTREMEQPGVLTELIASLESDGRMTIYVNRNPRSIILPTPAAFLSTAKLVIGNETVALTGPIVNGVVDATRLDVSKQRNWSGEIHHLAIYCRGFARSEILGPVEDSKLRPDVIRPSPSVAVTPGKRAAAKFIERLAGEIIPVDHPMVARVEILLAKGDRVGAAKLVTGDPASGEVGHQGFLNTVVKQLALKMSNREETIRAPLNDFVAAVVGVTRDERNAKELLTENFYYMGDPSRVTARKDYFRDILTSNHHYEDLESQRFDLRKILVRVPGPDAPVGYPRGQMIALDQNGSMTESPDPAGILTSRGFMSEHAIAGTNRRMVEFAFKQFLCLPMAEAADTSASPARIGRDVDRLPGGDVTRFETNCKGCHTVMDGFRGAFAKFDFFRPNVNGVTYDVIRNTDVSSRTGGSFGFTSTGGGRTVDANGVVYKLNHNNDVFPKGYEITDDSFVNNAVGLKNKALIGWRGPHALGGYGARQFGQAIADSKRFSQCMAKRVFEAVCAPGATSSSTITPAVEALGTKFEEGGYKIRSLFQQAVAHPACQF